MAELKDSEIEPIMLKAAQALRNSAERQLLEEVLSMEEDKNSGGISGYATGMVMREVLTSTEAYRESTTAAKIPENYFSGINSKPFPYISNGSNPIVTSLYKPDNAIYIKAEVLMELITDLETVDLSKSEVLSIIKDFIGRVGMKETEG
jgi:hypothetical protein